MGAQFPSDALVHAGNVQDRDGGVWLMATLFGLQTRQQLFEAIERAALRPLPAEPYVFAEWRLRRKHAAWAKGGGI